MIHFFVSLKIIRIEFYVLSFLVSGQLFPHLPIELLLCSLYSPSYKVLGQLPDTDVYIDIDAFEEVGPFSDTYLSVNMWRGVCLPMGRERKGDEKDAVSAHCLGSVLYSINT